MAIAPFHNLFLPRIRRAGQQRAYARQLLTQWQSRVPGRLLGELERLPLPIVGADGGLAQSLALVLMQEHRVCLQGPLGSGRSLAIEQLLVQWARGSVTIPATLPLHLRVPQIAPEPDVALQEAIKQAGFSNEALVVERGLSAGHWLIILDDLDAVPPSRREAWRRWALTLLRRYPALPLVVVLGPDEKPWAECSVWNPAPLTPELMQTWLAAMLPTEEPSLLLGPLLHDERVRLVGERFADLALLGWTYSQSGFPSNRGRLMATALDRLLRPLVGNDLVRVRNALASLGYAAANGGPQVLPDILKPLLPALQGILTPAPGGKVQFSRPLFAYACAALYCASHPLQIPEATTITPWPDILTLTAGLMADPELLYATISAAEPATPEHTLLLGRCLRQHHVPLHDWTPPILQRMARLASTHPALAGEVWRLFTLMPDVVAATFMEQLSLGSEGEQWALLVLRMLPPQMATSFVMEIVSDSRLARSTRRVAALQLQSLPRELTDDGLQALARRSLDPLGELLVLQALSSGSRENRHLVASLIQEGRVLPQPSDATDARMIVEIASSLLADPESDPGVQTAVTLAMQGCITEATVPGLLQACIAPGAALRAAARRALLTAEPSLALRALGRLVLGDDVHWAARSEALSTLQRMQGAGATALLHRVALSSIPLVGRIDAICALAERDGGGERLLAIAQQPDLPPALMAALAQVLGLRPTTHNAVFAFAVDPLMTSPVRANAVEALKQSSADEALALLCGIVERERCDLEVLLAAISGLQKRADESGIWALRSVLLGPLHQQLRGPWLDAVDQLALEQPPITWNPANLPTVLQWRWGRAMAYGLTDADAPTSLKELVEQEATLLRAAAAHALGAINGPAARDVLREALLAASSADGYGPAPALADELIRTDGTADVVYALHSHGAPLIRWVAANTLHELPNAGDAIRTAWSSIEVDDATRSAMLTALGSDSRIVPILETLVVDDHAPTALRIDAVQALGQAGAAHAEGLLLALISSARDEPALSTAALEVLNPPLAVTTLNAIRALLRMQRPPNEVAGAALRCLTRVGDTESLPLFLRYAQHDNPLLAIPAIDGLVVCNDSTANALLSRLAHTSGKSMRIRLHARGALLRLEGPQHLASVRQLVETGSLPTRLLALELLLDVLPDPAELVQVVRSSWPLPLRLRVAQALAKYPQPSALVLLEQALGDDHEGLALRILALETLSAQRYTTALPLIETLAIRSDVPLPLRRRAIGALQTWRAEPHIALTLSSLALDSVAYVRGWATAALTG